MLRKFFTNLKKIIVIYLIAKFLFIVSLVYIFHDAFFKHHVGKEITLVIPKGASTSEIAKLLYQNKVIQSKYLFILASQLFSLDKKYLKSGEYHFAINSTLMQVINKLIEGSVITHKITIPEGLTNYQIYKMVDNTYGLFGEINSSKYQEGYLLPETYLYQFFDTKESIINRMQSAMQNILQKITQGLPLPSPIKNQHELLTLASIVEKETHLNIEKSRIAAVYLNRLKRKMLLQADPTVIYGKTNGQVSLNRQLFYEDLKINSPYNTYKFLGLPPTPIANPGIKSIQAVLYPDETNELYFVADGNGGHKFASNYKDHVKNVRDYREFYKLKFN